MPGFWETKSLSEMTPEQWESLCDGCGRCCVVKIEGEDEQGMVPTQAACKMLDVEACRCTSYANRTEVVPRCLTVTPENAGSVEWIPITCAYRLLAEGKPLHDWHPLVSGDPDSVYRAGISVRGRLISEEHVHDDDLVQIRW